MARTRTLANLRADVRYIADIEGQTDRHPDANLTRLINQAWAAFRELISDNGFPYYLTASSSNFVDGTAAYVVPSDCVRVYGVDVTVGSDVRSLLEHSIMERNEWQTSVKGVPVSFWLKATADPPSLVMQPVPDSAYAYSVIYLPEQTDLSIDSNTINGFNGWEDWVVYRAALEVLTRDDDDEQFAKVERLLLKREAEIRSSAPKRSNVTPGHRIDTRGIRRRNARKSYIGYSS